MKTIKVEDLKPGMFVDSIVRQTGSLKIKSRGKITSSSVIEQLKSKGILEVQIDPSKAFETDEAPAPEPQPEAQEAEPEAANDSDQSPSADFDLEINRAKKLHDQGKAMQKKLMDSVMRGLPMNVDVPKEFTQQLVGSIDRNPNALTALTKIREKDTYLLEHSLNVAILLANFAQHLKLPIEQVQELALAGFLHDIGKIKIPDEILHKPGKLDDMEMNIMRDHVYYGVRTLERMDIPDSIVRTTSEHHERIDGYGYPDGLRGDEISYFGRMIAIVDTYDAMTADRCYKDGMPTQKALKILLAESPDKYDRDLVQQFIKCIGIYPVGSLVKLSSEQIAMVTEQRADKPLQPKVKIFYSTRGNHYIAPKTMDLITSQYKIEKAVTAREYGLDFNTFFNEKIAV